MAQQISALTPIDPFPSRVLPQDRFDQAVRTNMSQLSDMIGELNNSFIPSVNTISTQVENDASTASTSATTATNKAQEATTAAGTATTKAGEASTSATTASNKAGEAAASALLAQQVVGSGLATTSNAGLVKPDGTTISVGSDGRIAKNVYTSNVNIYVSKTGNDNNDGLTSSTPVLTVTRALTIAAGISTTETITVHFGEGDWGDVVVRESNIAATTFNVRSINANNKAHFTTLTIYGLQSYLYDIDCDYIECHRSRTDIYRCRFGKITSDDFSSVTLRTSAFVKPQEVNAIFAATTRSMLTIPNGTAVTLESDLTQEYFAYCYNRSSVYVGPSVTFTGTFSGKKYLADVGAQFITGRNPSTYPGTQDGVGNYIIDTIPQQGVVLTTGDQEIGGTKTFNGSGYLIDIKGSSTAFNGMNVYIMKRDKTQATQDATNNTGNFAINIRDKAGEVIGAIRGGLNSDSTTNLQMQTSGSISSQKNRTATVNLNVKADGTQEVSLQGHVIPYVDNRYSIGYGDMRWSVVYAATATINTSDERIKSNITPIPDAALDAWGEVNWVQYQFNDALAEKGDNARLHTGAVAQHIDSIFKARYLDATRYGLFCHDSWEAEDWDETIIDKEAVTETVTVVDKEAVYATRTVVISPAYTDEEGVEHPAETMEEQYEVSPEVSHEEQRVIEPEVSHVEHHHRDAGDLYSLRYEECFAMEAAYQRRKVAQLEARLAALEAKLG